MKELGIAMDFKSQNDNHWWNHLPMITSTICKALAHSTCKKLNNSLAKEPISTHAKCATWKLDTKDKKADLQSIVKGNCKHLSANHQRSYCSFFIWYELHFDGTLDNWKNKPVFYTMAKLSQCQRYTRYPCQKGWEVVYTGGTEAVIARV